MSNVQRLINHGCVCLSQVAFCRVRGRGLNSNVLPAKSLAAQRYVKLQTTQPASGGIHTKSKMTLINRKFKWQMSFLGFQP